MLDKKISVSEQVSNLPLEAQLFYTWAIPHADDVGLLPYSVKTLKATVIPLLDVSLDRVEQIVNELVNARLWAIYEYGGMTFYQILNFTKYQTLKKDRQPQTILPIIYFKNQRKSWEFIESLGFHLEDDGIQMDTEVKRSEEKRREVTQVKEGAESFETFWEKYPRKVAKQAARAAWSRLQPSEQLLSEILAGVEKWAKSQQWTKDGGQFIPHPATFLNGRRWEDDVPKPITRSVDLR